MSHFAEAKGKIQGMTVIRLIRPKMQTPMQIGGKQKSTIDIKEKRNTLTFVAHNANNKTTTTMHLFIDELIGNVCRSLELTRGIDT